MEWAPFSTLVRKFLMVLYGAIRILGILRGFVMSDVFDLAKQKKSETEKRVKKPVN